MSELRELYQQMIIDHGRHPRNFGQMKDPTTIKEGFNPLCGDKLVLYLELENNLIKSAKFEGAGCAISVASASLMTETLTGKTIEEAKQFFTEFHDALMKGGSSENLGKLTVLLGVSEFPARVKCATLAWHTMMAAIENNHEDTVCTE